MLRAYVIAFLIFLYAPIALLPVFAFNDGTVIAFPLDGFTTRWFGAMAGNAELRGALLNSLLVAVTTSILSVLLGLAAARANIRYRFPGKAAAMGLIMVPLVLPEIIVATSLLVVVVRILDLPLSLWTVIAAHTLICTPFAI
ncbi:MAG: ABC transporter permease, partial [Pseudomonadota bacterium]